LSNKNLSVKERKRIEFELEELIKNNALAKLKEKYNADVANRNALGQASTDLTNKYEAEKAAIEGKFRNEKIEAEKTMYQKVTETASMFFQGIKALAQGDFNAFSNMLAAKFNKETEHHTASQQKWGEKTQQIGEIVQQGLAAMTALSIAHFEARELKINKDAETQKAKFKEQFESGKISKEVYDKEILRIDGETAWAIHQERVKEFKRQKALQISAAVINAVQAGIMAFATLGPVAGGIAAAILAVGLGAQIMKIRNQPGPTWDGAEPPSDIGGFSGVGGAVFNEADPSFNLPTNPGSGADVDLGAGTNPYTPGPITIPEIGPIDIGPIAPIEPITLPGFKNGGKFAKGGLAKGPLHKDGGIWMWNPQTRQKVGELEGDEFIVNRESTAAHLGLLSAINNRAMIGRIRNSSFNKTGMPTYADGGVFSSSQSGNYEGYLQQANSVTSATFMYFKAINESIMKMHQSQNIGLTAIAKATGVTAQLTDAIVKNTDNTAKNTDTAAKASVESASNSRSLAEIAQNSRNLGDIANSSRQTANKDFSPNVSIIREKISQLEKIEVGSRM
jgi:hypothetical protein